MTDENQSRRGTPGEGDGPGTGAPPPGAADPEDALRSLERLEALARGEAPSVPPAVKPSATLRRKRPRVAASPRPVQTWARIAAPVAFLVAVIVVVSVAFQSGVVGGGEEKPAKPVAKASKTSTKTAKPTASTKPTSSAKPTSSPSPGALRTYTVKAGDTLSGIATKFGVSVTAIEELNTDQDLTTLQPGQKLKIPPQ